MADTDSKRERTKALLIDAAERLLQGDRPWDKITVAQIAAEAGVVKATIFNNFEGGKEELCRRVMLKLSYEAIQAMQPLESSPSGMRIAVEQVIELLTNNRQLAAMNIYPPGRRGIDVLLSHALERAYHQYEPDLLESTALASVLSPVILRTVVDEGDTSLDGPDLRPVWTVVNTYVKSIEDQELPTGIPEEFWNTLSYKAKHAWNKGALTAKEKENMLNGFNARARGFG